MSWSLAQRETLKIFILEARSNFEIIRITTSCKSRTNSFNDAKHWNWQKLTLNLWGVFSTRGKFIFFHKRYNSKIARSYLRWTLLKIVYESFYLYQDYNFSPHSVRENPFFAWHHASACKPFYYHKGGYNNDFPNCREWRPCGRNSWAAFSYPSILMMKRNWDGNANKGLFIISEGPRK